MAAIRVELELVDGQFQTRMMHAGQTLAQFNKAVAASTPDLAKMADQGQNVVKSISLADRSSRGFLSTLRDVAIVSGVVSVAFGKLANIQSTWVGDIVRINSEFERLNYQMRSMSTAADPIKEAGDNVRYLREQALDMPFKLSTINNAFVKLKATGTDPLNGSLQSLADGVAAFGGTDESFNRVVLGISQMSGKGVIQMEELRQQLGEQMPTAVAIMARSMGVSMSQLIKDISTGTVNAKEALSLFFAELDRSYGGRARYMMETFSGQISRVHTQLQNLALVVGGMDDAGGYQAGGFMDTLRTQLKDINELLGSQMGKALARELGEALTSIVEFTRSGIETLIEYRGEIMRFATMVAGAFVFKTAISGITNMSMALVEWVQKVRLAHLAWQTYSTALTGRGFLNALAQTASALALTAAAATPAIVGVGLAVYGVAEYFDLFDDKGKDAIETLKNFGATSREQMDLASDAVRRQEEEFKKLTDERERYIRNAARMSLPGLTARRKGITREEAYQQAAEEAAKAFDAENGYAEKRAEIDANRAMITQRSTEFQAEQQKKYVDGVLDGLDDLQRAHQATYNRLQIDTQDKWDKRVAAARVAGEAISELEKERGKELLDNQRKLLEQQEKELRDALAGQERLFIENGSGGHKAAADAITERLARTIEQRQQLAEITAGTPMIPGAANDKERFEKGQKHLERLKAEVAGLQASLSGANAEVVELQELLTRSQKYGHLEAEGVQELIDNLVEAQAQKELLDELMGGKNKLESDIERVRMNNIEREMELREKALGRQLSEAEKIKMRIQEGYYAGFGPQSQTQKWLELTIRTLGAQGETAAESGRVLRENIFGDQTRQSIRTTADELRNIATLLGQIGEQAGGISFNGFAGAQFRAGGTGPASFQSFAGAGSVMETAGRFQGMNESTDRNTLSQFFKEAGQNVDPEMTAWCAAFVNAVLATNGLKGTGSLSARSFLNYGQEAGMPTRGDIVVLKRGDNPTNGHVGFLDGFDENGNPRILGGNQGDGVNVKTFNKEDVLSYRRMGGADAGAPAAPAIPSVAPSVEANTRLTEIQRERNKLEEGYLGQLDDEIAKSKKLEGDEQALKRSEALKALKAQAKAASEDVDGLNKNMRALKEAVGKGDLGTSKDINAPEYKELVKAAQELDQVERQMAERKKASGEIERSEERFAQRRVELARQAEEAHKRMMDPLEHQSTRGYRQLERELDEYVRSVETYYANDKAKQAEALQFKQEMLRNFRQTESAEYFADLAKQSQDRRVSLMSESEQRRFHMNEQIEEIDRWVQRARDAGMSEVDITRQAEEAKAQIRAQYQREMSPMTGMMQEWGDLQGNLAKASANWMNGLADGLTNLIMGTGDLRSMVSGMLKDILNMGIKYMMSQFMGSKGQAPASGGKGKAGKALSSAATKGKGKGVFSAHHTGGIVGRPTRLTRVVDPRAFIGAPKFHTGGIIGGPRLTSDEVPIIAKKGEGVFTPEQMEQMGGFSSTSFQINAPITVNGSSGTPEQNQDLAKRMAKEVEGTMRGMVASEIQRQIRPGNMLNSRRS